MTADGVPNLRTNYLLFLAHNGLDACGVARIGVRVLYGVSFHSHAADTYGYRGFLTGTTVASGLDGLDGTVAIDIYIGGLFHVIGESETCAYVYAAGNDIRRIVAYLHVQHTFVTSVSHDNGLTRSGRNQEGDACKVLGIFITTGFVVADDSINVLAMHGGCHQDALRGGVIAIAVFRLQVVEYIVIHLVVQIAIGGDGHFPAGVAQIDQRVDRYANLSCAYRAIGRWRYIYQVLLEDDTLCVKRQRGRIASSSLCFSFP